MLHIRLQSLLVLVATALSGLAQSNQPEESTKESTSETGAVSFYTSGGWSFGVPAVRAAVSIPKVGSAISPEKKTLPAVGVGMTVTAWKFLVPFVDFSAIDTGKATAQVGSFTSQAQANTYTFNGGLRFVGGHSRLRPYAQVGGGILHQDLKATFYQGTTPTSASGSASLGTLTYGGGLQYFIGRKWGSTMGFDGFHVNKPLNGAGQNYSMVHFGLFYQTKSAIQ